MSTLEELLYFCNEKEPTGALMLTGEWGCGKTYLIEHDLKDALKDSHNHTPDHNHEAEHKKTCLAFPQSVCREMRLEYILWKHGELLTRVTKKCSTEQVGIPLAGVIPCGPPEEEVENIEEYIFMPRALLGEGTFFILRADGDSMVDAGINEGDLVVVRRQLEATSGQIVAALVDGGSTLKRLRYNNQTNQYELHPENKEKNYPPVEGNHISIQGVAVKMMKSLE